MLDFLWHRRARPSGAAAKGARGGAYRVVMTLVRRLAVRRGGPRTESESHVREDGQGLVAVRDADHGPGAICNSRRRNVTASVGCISRDRTASSTHGKHLSILPAQPSVTHNRSQHNNAQASSCAGTPHLQQTPTIAIVDDDGSVRLAIESLVRSLGFGARTFASAQEFLQTSEPNEAACVIADVQMPGMSGVDLQEALLRRGLRIPIIFITAFPEDRIRDRVLKAGAASYLVKPFDGRTLIDCLRMALQKPWDGTSV
jgi:CheY-like chemotaxis protein